LTGLGSTIEILILGRITQGIAAAIFTPPCYATVFSVMPSHKQGIAMGTVVAASDLGLSAGPTLAGFILKYLSWQWIFYINIPLGLLVVFYIILFVPKDQQRNPSIKIDSISVILLSMGFAGVLFALNQIEVWDWRSPLLWSIGLTGVISLLLFWKRDSNYSFQMVPRSLLRNPVIMATITTISIIAFNFALILVMMGLYLQNILSLSNYEAGIIFLWLTLTIGGLSPIGGKLADKIDMRLLIIAGLLLMGCAAFLMSFLGISSSVFYVSTCLGVAGLGCGLCFPTINTAILRSVPATELNTATGLFTMAMMVGNSLGVIISTSLLVSLGRLKLNSLLSTADLNLNISEVQKLEVLIAQADLSATHFKDFTQPKVPALLKIVNQAFAYGMSYNMLVGMTLILTAIIVIYKYLGNLKADANQGSIIPIL
jgi:MFS family permease